MWIPENSLHCTTLFVVAIVTCMSNYMIIGVSSRSLNSSFADAFSPAVATWYGNPTGGGTGGACGFDDNDMGKPPFNSYTSAGNNNLFKSGSGCGSCYKVQCTGNPLCSGSPVTVTITNQCPGACNSDPVHFDLSGTAFGGLAKPGQGDALRKVGRIGIQYLRVACHYNQGIVFAVTKKSNPNYLAFAVEFVNGDGTIGSLELLPSSNPGGIAMQRSFGATWAANLPNGVRGPYDVRVTTFESKQSVVAKNAIPANWAPGQRYQVSVNIPV